MNTLERARAKHNTFASDVSKLALKRDKALDALIRAEARYRKAVKAVGRSSKRLDKLREQARAVKAAREARKNQPAAPVDAQLNDMLGI
jgi:hypothetical protein